LAVAVVVFSRAKINLIDTVMFNITAAFLNYSIPKVIKKISKFEIASSTIIVTNNRHYI